MRFRFVVLILLIFLANCQSDTEPGNPESSLLLVSAAISLKDAFDEIGKSFELKTGKKITFNYGASGALQQQIEAGAPVDVFASAGVKQMDELAAKNLIDNATRINFARNQLILIVPRNSILSINSFADLSKSEVQKIAVGNPKTVPAGQYTEESLNKLNLKESLERKMILAENVRQVLDYVSRGETDAGIVYASDVLAAKDSIRVAATADENSHTPILYPIAVTTDSKQQSPARQFVDFVSQSEGQNILQKYGFAAAPEK